MSTRSSRSRMAAVALMAGTVLPLTAAAQSTSNTWETGKWRVGASIYAYLPSFGGQMKFPVETGGSSINVDADTIIDSLKMTFMGSLDVHNGRWGLFTDVIYMDVEGDKSQHARLLDRQQRRARRHLRRPDAGPEGHGLDARRPVPRGVRSRVDRRRAGGRPHARHQAHARLDDHRRSGPDHPAGRTGNKEIDETVWDGIVGVKGRYAFGADRRWFVPFYGDIGTGESDLTWQAAAGVGYAFRWGEVIALWRYIDYKFKSDKQLEDLTMNGPMFGVPSFSW